MLDIEAAADLARTGDVWLFRGRTLADRTIRTISNAPVNHVGISIVIDDLPPLLLHAELSKKQQDLWTGGHHRGVQLHDLATAVRRWRDEYGQEVWMRQLAPEISREQEDAALRCVARLNGVAYPAGARAISRWFRGRSDGYQPHRQRGQRLRPEEAICSETVAMTLQEMGVLEDDRKPHWYDPGTFWSGDYLPLRNGWTYGAEIAVGPPLDPDRVVPSARDRWR